MFKFISETMPFTPTSAETKNASLSESGGSSSVDKTAAFDAPRQRPVSPAPVPNIGGNTGMGLQQSPSTPTLSNQSISGRRLTTSSIGGVRGECKRAGGYRASFLLTLKNATLLDSVEADPHDKVYKGELDIIAVNLRGTLFMIPFSAVKAYPECRLANLNYSMPNYDPEEDEFYFNRNPEIFNYILDFYIEGYLHFPMQFCIKVVINEMRFWKISPDHFDQCCWEQYQLMVEEEESYLKTRAHWRFASENPHRFTDVRSKDDNKDKNKKYKCCYHNEKLNTFFEKPLSSKPALMWGMLIVFVILSLNIFLCIDSSATGQIRDTEDRHKSLIFSHENSMWLIICECICIAILTFDWAIRFATCANKAKFIRRILNLVDILAIIPGWVYWPIYIIFGKEQIFANNFLKVIVTSAFILRIFWVFQVLRAIKILGFSSLKIITMVVKSSFREMLLLIILILIATLFFGNLLYYMELKHNNLASPFEGFWWAVITLTTVGYGNTVPRSPEGYIVGGFCALTGLVVVALPVPIIAAQFLRYHHYLLRVEREKQREAASSIKISPLGPISHIQNEVKTELITLRES